MQQLSRQEGWYGPDTGDKEADKVVRLGPASMDGGRVDMAMRKGTHAAVRPGRFLAAFTAKALVGGWRTSVIVPPCPGAPYALALIPTRRRRRRRDHPQHQQHRNRSRRLP